MRQFLALFFLLFTLHSFGSQDSTGITSLLRGKGPDEQMLLLDSFTKAFRYADPPLAVFCVRQNLSLLENAPRDSATFYRMVRAAKVLRDHGEFSQARLVFNKMENFLSGATPDMLFEFYNTRGTFFRYIGAFDLSMSDYLAALAVAERTDGKEWKAILYNNIAGIHFALERMDAAIENFTKSRDLYKELHSEINAALASDNIGMAYFALKRYKEALSAHFLAMDVLSGAGPNYHHARCTNYSSLALVYKDLKQIDVAREYFRLAKASADSAGNYGNNGLIYLNLGDLELAERNYKKAEELIRYYIVLVRDTLETFNGLETAYITLAQIYIRTGMKDSAIKYVLEYQKMRDSLYSQDISANIAQYETLYESDKKEHQITLLEKDKERQKLILYSVIGGMGIFTILILLLIRSNAQRKKTNKLLEEKSAIIEARNKDITDSINYAKRIQFAFQPSRNMLKKLIPEWFILQKPRDIVSGDFFWFGHQKERIIFAVADCTGHGVPGALMSMVGLNFLEQSVKELGHTQPALILNDLHKRVVHSLNENVEKRSSMDGMDVALIEYDPVTGRARYAGAVRPLVIKRKTGIEIIKGDRYSVGGVKDLQTPFTEHELKLEKGDIIYLFSDGYADQFNAITGKKFMIKKFYQFLEEISTLSMQEQESRLLLTLDGWKGATEQTDDVLVVGIRI